MRRRNITWVWLLGAAFMVGCGKQVPEDIIQPDRMENILYDYHLSISMGNNLSYSDNYQRRRIRIMSSRSIILLKLISIRPWCGTHVTRRNLPVFIKRWGNASAVRKNACRSCWRCVRINRLHRCREILWMYGMTVNFIG